MKWKKKSGALRAEAHGVIFKIEEIEDEFALSFRTPSGGWEKCETNSSMESAKDRAEKVADLYRQLAEHDARMLELRRSEAKRIANMDPAEKAIRTLFGMYREMSNMERFAARKMRPDLCYMFDEFDKALAPKEVPA